MSIVLSRRAFAAVPVLAGLGMAVLGTQSAIGQSQSAGDPGDPVAAAVSLANEEIHRQYWPLYRQMHSDARTQVPSFAMQYRYEHSFLPRGPQPISAKGTRTIE